MSVMNEQIVVQEIMLVENRSDALKSYLQPLLLPYLYRSSVG